MRLAHHFNSTWGEALDAEFDNAVVGWDFNDPLEPFGEGLVAGEAPPAKHAHYTNAEVCIYIYIIYIYIYI